MEAIGKPRLLVHDLRRSVVQMSMLAGMPQAVAMKMAGLLMPQMRLGYNILDEVAMRAGQEKLEALMAPPERPAEELKPLRTK